MRSAVEQIVFLAGMVWASYLTARNNPPWR